MKVKLKDTEFIDNIATGNECEDAVRDLIKNSNIQREDNHADFEFVMDIHDFRWWSDYAIDYEAAIENKNDILAELYDENYEDACNEYDKITVEAKDYPSALEACNDLLMTRYNLYK